MFFSLKGQSVMEFQGEEVQLNSLILEFISIFAHNIDEEIFKIEISSLQNNTEGLRLGIGDFVNKYKSAVPEINKLNTFIKKLDDGEYFYILPNVKKLSDKQTVSISNELLSHIDSSVDFASLQKSYINIFQCVFDNYEMTSVSTERKIKIGERVKANRVCRFCKNTIATGATFKQEAHAISESLGNKTIILNEECDTCNAYFSQNVENNIFTYLKIFTTFFGVKNKSNNISKIKGKNFEYENTGDKNIILKFFDEDNADLSQPPVNIPLKFYDKINKQSFYKALCKFALSIIDSKNISHFDETTKWIRTDKYYEKLPKIATLASYSFFDKHPRMIVYIRKTDNQHLPFCVGEFHFTFLTFVFIVPTFSSCEDTFNNDKEYEVFWNCFKHFKEIKDWNLEDYSDHYTREIVFNMNFKQNDITK
jgi:hypothetical protein